MFLLDAVGIKIRSLNISEASWRRRKVTLDAVAAHDETLDSGSFYLRRRRSL